MKSLHLTRNGAQNREMSNTARGVVLAGAMFSTLVSPLTGCLDPSQPSAKFKEPQVLCETSADNRSAYMTVGGVIDEKTRKTQECKGIDTVAIPSCEKGEVKVTEISCKDQGKRCDSDSKECSDVGRSCDDSGPNVVVGFGDQIVDTKPKKECNLEGSAVVGRSCGPDAQIAETQTPCASGEECDPTTISCKKVYRCEVQADGSLRVVEGIDVRTIVPECGADGKSFSKPRCDGDRLVSETVECPATYTCPPLQQLNPLDAKCDIPVVVCRVQGDVGTVSVAGVIQQELTRQKRCADNGRAVLNPYCPTSDSPTVEDQSVPCDEGTTCNPGTLECETDLNCETLENGRIRVTNGVNVTEEGPVCSANGLSYTAPACNGNVPTNPTPIVNCPQNTYTCSPNQQLDRPECTIPVVSCRVQGNIGTVTVAGVVQQDRTKQKRCNEDGTAVLMPFCPTPTSETVEDRVTQCRAGQTCDDNTLSCQTIRSCETLDGGRIRVTNGVNVTESGPTCSADLRSRNVPACLNDNVPRNPAPVEDCPAAFDCDVLAGTCSVPVIDCSIDANGNGVVLEGGVSVETASRQCKVDGTAVVNQTCPTPHSRHLVPVEQPCGDHHECNNATKACDDKRECVPTANGVEITLGGVPTGEHAENGCQNNAVVTATCVGTQIVTNRQQCVGPSFACDDGSLSCLPVTRCLQNGTVQVMNGDQLVEDGTVKCSLNGREVQTPSCATPNSDHITWTSEICDPGFSCGVQGGILDCYASNAKCFEVVDGNGQPTGEAVQLDADNQPIEATRQTPSCNVQTNTRTKWRCNAEGQVVSDLQSCGPAADSLCDAQAGCVPQWKCNVNASKTEATIYFGGELQNDRTRSALCDGVTLRLVKCAADKQTAEYEDSNCADHTTCDAFAGRCNYDLWCETISANGQVVRAVQRLGPDQFTGREMIRGCIDPNNIGLPACQDGTTPILVTEPVPAHYTCNNGERMPLLECVIVRNADGSLAIQAVQTLGGVANGVTADRACADANTEAVPVCNGNLPATQANACGDHRECNAGAKACRDKVECVEGQDGQSIFTQLTDGGVVRAGSTQRPTCQNPTTLLNPDCNAENTAQIQLTQNCADNQNCNTQNSIGSCQDAPLVCAEDAGGAQITQGRTVVQNIRNACSDAWSWIQRFCRTQVGPIDNRAPAQCAQIEECKDTADGTGLCTEATPVCTRDDANKRATVTQGRFTQTQTDVCLDQDHVSKAGCSVDNTQIVMGPAEACGAGQKCWQNACIDLPAFDPNEGLVWSSALDDGTGLQLLGNPQPTFVPGVVGNAMRVTAGDDYAQADGVVGCAAGSPFTVSVLAKWEARPNDVYGTIITSGTNATNRQFHMYWDQNDGIAFRIRTDRDNTILVRHPSEGKFVHLVGIYDSSSLLFYINGTLVGNIPNLQQPVGFLGPVRFGRLGYTGGNSDYQFTGLEDEARYYCKALSRLEILSLYISYQEHL